MLTHLICYLQDNRDQIIENWLTETEIPAAEPADTEPADTEPADTEPADTEPAEGGAIPYALFADAFNTVIQTLQNDNQPLPDRADRVNINHFIGLTCDCMKHGFDGRVCLELHETGLSAFMSVFDDEWDIDHEFNPLDRKLCSDRISHALSSFFSREIELCQGRESRPDCPFAQ
jgi:hypothetical protein